MKRFPSYRQPDAKDCGPTCLKIVSKYYNKTVDLQLIRDLSEVNRTGTSLQNLSFAAEGLGFKSLPVKISMEKLNTAPLPLVIFWNANHFVVLYKIKNKQFFISDPAVGLINYSLSVFTQGWLKTSMTNHQTDGIALLLEPTAKFYDSEFKDNIAGIGWSFLWSYVIKYKSFIVQLFIGLIAGSLIQLLFPFLIQSIVDVGINNRDINFIYLILIAQLFLFVGRTAIEVIRSWILLHIGARINISLVSDFFIKLMSLPMSFFDSRLTGDILQRIYDHKRIEQAMTVSSMNILFSFFNILIFGTVLLFYNVLIFNIFVGGTIVYVLWIVLFLRKRRILDHKTFLLECDEHTKNIELINGMQEIKLNNAEKVKRWNWEQLQVQLFKLSIKTLTIEQYQSVGSGFINELKNILIIVISAKLVIDGSITLGMMLAISYIIGQLNSPVALIMDFIKDTQDAKISLERVSEIYQKNDEENKLVPQVPSVPNHSGIRFKNLSFRYRGSQKLILKNINFIIPPHKTTAIVGPSGSGKTTLLKLLLKFYEPTKGKIEIDNINLKNISQHTWRKECGTVLQEGYIFYDTIANNIALGQMDIDRKKLSEAVEMANAREFIEEFPLAYNTEIGSEGVGLSTGQKQRILIARAVYKNPNYLLVDEATSALDSVNEKNVMDKLKLFFQNRTVVIIAHRLSTIKFVDHIIMLDKGKVIETGTHKSLVAMKGMYYTLVKDQLELGT